MPEYNSEISPEFRDMMLTTLSHENFRELYAATIEEVDRIYTGAGKPNSMTVAIIREGLVRLKRSGDARD